MVHVFEWKVVCRCCEMPILLPDATFLQQSYSRGSQPTPQDPIAIACPHCKRVAIYDQIAPPHHHEIQPSTPRAERIRVSCEEEGCGEFLIVIAVCGPTDSAQEVRLSWKFEEGVRCSNGHQFHPLSTIER